MIALSTRVSLIYYCMYEEHEIIATPKKVYISTNIKKLEFARISESLTA
jgi:hypothetical protein